MLWPARRWTWNTKSDGEVRRPAEYCVRYGSIPLVLGHNPSAVQIDNTAAAAAIIDGHAYGLVQLHMHCPSEHTFSGTHAAMGLHLVHHMVDSLEYEYHERQSTVRFTKESG